MAPPGSGRDRISELLLEIRDGRRQVDMAARSGVSQGTISKYEKGERTPKPEAAKAYAEALGASPEQVRELVAACQSIAELTVTRQTRIVRKGADAQRRIRDVERLSREIRSWQVEIVPGLMQAWDYTTAILRRTPTDEWTEARRERLALLDDPRKRFLQVVPEGVVRTVVGSVDVMRAQLEHLSELSLRPNIRLGIVPQGQPVPPLEPSFHLYGDRLATNETIVGTVFLDERPDLAKHRQVFDLMDGAAVHDDGARAILAAAARDLAPGAKASDHGGAAT